MSIMLFLFLFQAYNSYQDKSVYNSNPNAKILFPQISIKWSNFTGNTKSILKWSRNDFVSLLAYSHSLGTEKQK